MTDDVEEILMERGAKYGPFSGHARVTQGIKEEMRMSLSENENFQGLEDGEKAVVTESLDMIAHKIGRIVNGDPLHLDSWDDMAGYAKLVSKYIKTRPPF